MQSVSPHQGGAGFVTDQHMEACWTIKLLLLETASLANDNIEIGFRWWNGHGSRVARGIDIQTAMFDDVSLWKAIRISILLHVSFLWISATELCDMKIRLCMSKGRKGHANVADCKLFQWTTNKLDIVLPVMVKQESQNYNTNWN